MAAPTRPVLRYHGGKFRNAPWIIANLPAHRVYVEPFGGAASVLMRKPRSDVEVYNDLDGEIVNVFRVLRDPIAAARLRDVLMLTPFSRSEYRAAQKPHADPVEQARRTMLKAWMGFGSGAIVHATAGFRVAFSPRRHTAREWANYPRHIPAFAERLAGVFVEEQPAAAVMDRYDAPDALHFLDPPYLTTTRGSRHRYRCEMDEAGHVALAQHAHRLVGAVVLCGYASPLYDELYAGWERRERESRDALSNARTEVLWLKSRPTLQGEL